MAGKVVNYYVGGNTAKGFHSFLENNILDLNKLIVIKGELFTIKSNIMKSIGEFWVKNNNDIEYMHAPSDNDLVEGVINTTQKIGIIDGSNRHNLQLVALDIPTDIINLDDVLDKEYLDKHKHDLSGLNDDKNIYYEKCYEHYLKALKIHDEWEEIYINKMDKEYADIYSDEVIDMLIKDTSFNKHAVVKDRFFGAATPLGPVDFIPNITSYVSKRYLIKGRPGTGKSTLLKRLVKRASENGIDVEVYHCGFDPYSLDMVMLRELDLVIFDSTAPHEYFPELDNDEVIDMYAKIIASKTDELYEDKLNEIISRYKVEVDLGTNYLKKVYDINNKLEAIYSCAVDLDQLSSLSNELMAKLISIDFSKENI